MNKDTVYVCVFFFSYSRYCSHSCIYEVAFEAEVIYASTMNTRTRIGIVFR